MIWTELDLAIAVWGVFVSKPAKEEGRDWHKTKFPEAGLGESEKA